MLLLLLSVGLCLYGLANTGLGIFLLGGGGADSRDFVRVLKGLSFLGLGLFAGHFALRLLRSEGSAPPATTAEEIIARAAAAPPAEDASNPPAGRGWSVVSILLALGAYVLLWLAFYGGPYEVVRHEPKWAIALSLVGLVCAGYAIGQARQVSVPSALGLLLNAGPYAVLITLALMFT